MKTAKEFGEVRRVRYYPEVAVCLTCGSPLRPDHAVWRKHIITLTEVLYAVNMGCYCRNPTCAQGRVVYRSAAAEALSLRAHSYGLDVIAHVGTLRWYGHQTRQEIHADLCARGVAISEREVQNLYEAYAVLLRSSAGERLAERRAAIQANGGMILAVDGVQPEKGNACLWVVREVLTGTTLAARNLDVSDAAAIRGLLAPLASMGLPILGVISDAQKAIRLAVADLWPDIPHQLCHFHFLRDVAQPAITADRALKTDLKQELRGVAAVEQRVKVRADADASVILGYAAAIRAVLLEDGRPPLDLPGVKIYAALEMIEASLEQCVRKRGTAN